MCDSKFLCGTRLELWYELVQHGVKLSGRDLFDERKHYLITVFDRTFDRKEGSKLFIEGSVVLMLNEALEKEKFNKRQALRFVGDACLICAGFSQCVTRAFKKIEKSPKQYYINMGEASFMMLYAEYENRKQRNKGSTYRLVATNINSLVEVLSSINNHEPVVESLYKTTVDNVTYL